MKTISVPPVAPFDQAASVRSSGASSRKVMVAAALGNALEIFDFTVYSFFAALIGKLFFPVEGVYGQLLLSFATFGIGFVARPLGGIVLGAYADRHGRKKAMTLTILLMAVATALLGLAPTYAQIGMAAPLLLVAARLVQGFSAGGEVSAAITFMMESAAPGKRGYMLGWQMASQGAAGLAGALSGVVLTQTLSHAALESWGWRVPFLLGLLIAPVGFYIRSQLDETYHATPHNADAGATRVQYDVRRIVLGILLMLSTTASGYVVIYYLPSYLVKVAGMQVTTSLYSACVACLVLTFISPLCGKFADRLGKHKPILYVTTIGNVFAIPLLFMVVLKTLTLVAILPSVAVLVALTAFSGPAGLLLLLEGFPRHIRGRSIGIVYSIGVTLFGGFAPATVTWLLKVTNNPYAPAWYLVGCTLISLAALCLFDELVTD